MHDARSAYLETQVLTAAPQKLRLMLIDAAIRLARQASDAHAAGNGEQFCNSLERTREIVTELISGIRPENTELTQAARALYGFIFRSLSEAQLYKDPQKIEDALRVLDQERQTWLAVCELEPEAPSADEPANFRQQEIVASAPLIPAATMERFSLDA